MFRVLGHCGVRELLSPWLPQVLPMDRKNQGNTTSARLFLGAQWLLLLYSQIQAISKGALRALKINSRKKLFYCRWYSLNST